MNALPHLPRIDPHSLKRQLDDGSAVLIDVREPDEHARERIPGARLVPLSRLEAQTLHRPQDKVIVFHCRSGNRTTTNAGRLQAAVGGEAYELDGGIEAWKRAGLPVQTDRSQPIELMRQVQIAAGSLVLLGLVLAVLLSPWFALLSAFVGAGLVFAGVTGFCGMARLLACLPWNRHAASAA